MSSFLNMIDNSFIKAMFKSLWVFSMTLADSATLIDEARKVPAEIIGFIELINMLGR